MGGLHFGKHHSHDLDTESLQVAKPWRRGGRDGLKLGIALALVFVTAVMPTFYYLWHISIFAGLALVVVWARIPLLPLLKRLLLFSPFILGTALASLWHGPGGAGWQTVALRGSLCLSIMLVLSSLIPFSVLPGLLKRAGMPELLATIMMLMHRYLFVLGDERERMIKASSSRCLRPGSGSAWAISAGQLGRLFVRASSRAERVYNAMCARGWQ